MVPFVSTSMRKPSTRGRAARLELVLLDNGSPPVNGVARAVPGLGERALPVVDREARSSPPSCRGRPSHVYHFAHQVQRGYILGRTKTLGTPTLVPSPCTVAKISALGLHAAQEHRGSHILPGHPRLPAPRRASARAAARHGELRSRRRRCGARPASRPGGDDEAVEKPTSSVFEALFGHQHDLEVGQVLPS